MVQKIYCGEGGQYGPFDIQEDGWPNAGQVMRYFREKIGITAKALGVLYGQKVQKDARPICERWILEMELENKVPTDITRRRVITQLLQIPPAFLGLAVLEDTAISPIKDTISSSSPTQANPPKTALKRVTTDITKYEVDIRFRWKLYATSNAEDSIRNIQIDLKTLEQLVIQAKGDFLYHLQELVFSNYLLASAITRNKRQYKRAYSYANEAVRVAKAINDSELVSAALYTRGCQRLVWGLYGTINENGTFAANDSLLKDAIRDFENAKEEAHPQLKGLIATQISRAQAPLHLKNIVLTNLDEAANMIGEGKIDDSYTRTLVTGTYTGFHEGRYLTERATALNAIGLPGQALKAINTLKILNRNTYGKDETPRFAWIDIITAESYLGLKDYQQATSYAKKSLEVCQDIHSSNNIVIITDLYGRLLTSPYGKSTDVEELGEMLKNEKMS